MTTPVITTINPSKAKTWIAVIGGLLTVAVPLILSVATYLPDPWPAVIGALVALATAAGVYKAPYKPEGTSVVANSDLNQVAIPVPPTPPVTAPTPPVAEGGYQNPWK